MERFSQARRKAKAIRWIGKMPCAEYEKIIRLINLDYEWRRVGVDCEAHSLLCREGYLAKALEYLHQKIASGDDLNVREQWFYDEHCSAMRAAG